MKKVKCRDCVFGIFERTEKGNIRISISGECSYIVPVPKVPNSVAKYYNYQKNPFQTEVQFGLLMKCCVNVLKT